MGGKGEEKVTWNNSIEFLMSCVALSVGFGNIWRFPYIAYANGGGAFLIPYLILLFLVGKPFYYLEMIIGQFSGRSIKVWNLSPAFYGVGFAQLWSMIMLATYYCSLMALTLHYLVSSFAFELPWAHCRREWNDSSTLCIDSSIKKRNLSEALVNKTNETQILSSAELYFSKEVLKIKDNINDGVGWPDWQLTLCLLGSWVLVCLIVSRGIKSSGKYSYFLAIFPYIVLITLLIRSVTLQGAWVGIWYFIKPDWKKLTEAKVWYEAVTQSFFSLSVCFGAIITYSSHNKFRHSLYRDVMIITSLDTLTSLIAGCTIFGILGNLSYETGANVSDVVKSSAGIAFISYPDAIAKFSFVPQLFSVLFFLMIYVLGVGTSVGITNSITSTIREICPIFKQNVITYLACLIGFLSGLIYVTPGGQLVLELVDFYGTSFVVFCLASFEVIGVIWVYGLQNFLDDVDFMLCKRPSFYWRICWLVFTPLILIILFVYNVYDKIWGSGLVKYNGNVDYPTVAHAIGGVILGVGLIQIPLWMVVSLIKNGTGLFRPSKHWGPQNIEERQKWVDYKRSRLENRSHGILRTLYRSD